MKFVLGQNTVWIDMDGVLADFDSWVWGQLPREETSDGQMWKWLQAQDRPYFRFLPMPRAGILWQEAQHMVGPEHTKILTGIPFKNHMPEVENDKRDWLAKYQDRFPGAAAAMNVGPYARDKYKHCKPGDVLIDDNERNIIQWIMAGGFGIYHTDVDESVKLLRTVLKESGNAVL